MIFHDKIGLKTVNFANMKKNLQKGLKISQRSKWIKFAQNDIFTSGLTVVCKSEQKSAQKMTTLGRRK